MYIMCVILCLFSALSRRVCALRISIIISLVLIQGVDWQVGWGWGCGGGAGVGVGGSGWGCWCFVSTVDEELLNFVGELIAVPEVRPCMSASCHVPVWIGIIRAVFRFHFPVSSLVFRSYSPLALSSFCKYFYRLFLLMAHSYSCLFVLFYHNSPPKQQQNIQCAHTRTNARTHACTLARQHKKIY